MLCLLKVTGRKRYALIKIKLDEKEKKGLNIKIKKLWNRHYGSNYP